MISYVSTSQAEGECEINSMLKSIYLFLLIFVITIAGCASNAVHTSKLHAQGFGDALSGMSPAQISKALSSEFTVELWGPPEEKYLCYYISLNNTGHDLYIMIEEEKATRFEIHSSNLETTIGLKVGDSEESVIKLLNANLQIEDHPYMGEDGKYILYKTAEDSGYLFVTQHGIITEIRSGRLTSIEYIEGCF